jgi:ribosomal protein S18 acetylase RimI-like enzyme
VGGSDKSRRRRKDSRGGRAMRIRRAVPRDLDAVDAVEAGSFSRDRFPRRNLRRLLRSRSAAVLIAEAEAPLGYVLLLFRKGAKAARLYSLAVAPKARGKGIGRALVYAAARFAIEKGCDRIRLEVRASNRSAARLYESAGFGILKTVPGYYEDGETALLMEQRLQRDKAAR